MWCWVTGKVESFSHLGICITHDSLPSLALPVDCLILSHHCIDTSSATWDKVAKGFFHQRWVNSSLPWWNFWVSTAAVVVRLTCLRWHGSKQRPELHSVMFQWMFKHLLSKSAFFQDIFNPFSKWNSGLKRFSVLTIALFTGYFLLWNSRLMHLLGRLGVSFSLDFKLRDLESSLLLGQMVKLFSSSRSHEVENCRAVESSCWVWGAAMVCETKIQMCSPCSSICQQKMLPAIQRSWEVSRALRRI